jgi:hypothetical protein
MFGVASFHGTDPRASRGRCRCCITAISRLGTCAPRARADGFQAMDLIAEETARPEGRDPRDARAHQGLSAAGRFRGRGGFVDRPFNCIDVCLVMDVARMSERHKAIYTRGADATGGGR